MTVVFMGTGEIGAPVLRWLIEHSGHQVVAVVCQPDKPVGRRQTMTAPVTKQVALASGVPVLQPEKINDPAAVEEVLAWQADLMVVMAYGQFLPKRIREGARLGCINLHASLLPRWRGASPIQSALAAGDAETGVTVMRVVREMDAGEMILAGKISITAEDTGQSLHDRLAQLAPLVLERALPLLEAGTAPSLAQPAPFVTHCAKLTREAGRLDWSRPAVELERLIRAYDPWPGTHTLLPASWGGRILKVFPPVMVVPRPTAAVAHPGEILAVDRATVTVAAGTDALMLHSLQTEGQKRLLVREFLAGTRLEVGQVLGQVAAGAE